MGNQSWECNIKEVWAIYHMQVVMGAWVMGGCKNSRIPHVFKVWGQFGLDVKYLAEADTIPGWVSDFWTEKL